MRPSFSNHVNSDSHRRVWCIHSIRTTVFQNPPSVSHTRPSIQQKIIKVLKGTLFMETTEHFGEHFRKHHKNWRMLPITSLTIYPQMSDTHKTSRVQRKTRPPSYCTCRGWRNELNAAYSIIQFDNLSNFVFSTVISLGQPTGQEIPHKIPDSLS